MFRKMRRFKQEIPVHECHEVLKTETRGVLSVHGEDGYPYGIPLNHYFDESDGKIYFHGAKEGHKLDAIKADNRVCYTVIEKGFREEGDWAYHVRSVIVFGRIALVSDEDKAAQVCDKLSRKFTGDEEYIANEIQKHLSNVQCMEITIDHISGKRVVES